MLGYPAHFGQIECLKLVAGSNKYADKRLGYLGIMLLLDENQEVLTLVTNSLKNDMNSQNMYTVGLALVTMGNIASKEMARDLAPEIDKLMGSSNSYIRKKAILTCGRILKKVPDLTDQFLPKAKQLLNEKNHSVLLASVVLLKQMCEDSHEALSQVRPLVLVLNRHLKSLIAAGSSPEHDVGGINDPFLQVKILHLMRVLGKGDTQASEQMNDVLAQIATNTDGSKNVGNSILYETCLTIMDIEADNSLRVLAVNILGRFLGNTDNNIRYVALNTLSRTISIDLNAVQRHRGTVLECLQDTDISIKRRALDLSFSLINETNVRVMIRELLSFLETADSEFRIAMPARICAAADQFAPNKRWHIDTIIRVLKLAGNYVKEDVLSNFIKLVANVPELHAYSVYKLYYSLKQDLSQESLILAAVWTIGEFGEVLLQSSPQQRNLPAEDPLDDQPNNDSNQVTEKEIIDLLGSILDSPYNTTVVTEYILTALLKLTTRVTQPASVQSILLLIQKYASVIDLELQQRSIEYLTLLTDSGLAAVKAKVLERMPVPPPTLASAVAPGGSTKQQSKASSPGKAPASGGGLLDDLLSLNETMSSPAAVASSNAGLGGLDLLGGFGAPSASTAAPVKPTSGVDLLADVFGSTGLSSVPAQPAGPKSKDDILGLFGSTASPSLLSKPTVGASAISPTGSNVSNPAGIPPLGGLGSPVSGQPLATGNNVPSVLSVSPVFQNNSSTFGFATTSQLPSPSSEVSVYDKNGLTIKLSYKHDPVAAPEKSALVTASFSSKTEVTDLNFQVAVPKSLKLNMLPATGTIVKPGPTPSVTQQMKVINPIGANPDGQSVPLKLRLKIMYSVGPNKYDELAEFGGFPNFTW